MLPSSSPDDAVSPGDDRPAPANATERADAPKGNAAPAGDPERAGPEEPRRLHPLTLAQRILISLPAAAFILLPLVTSPDSGNYFSVVFAAAYGLLALPLIALRYYRFRYWITDREIVIQSGVLNRQDRSIPIERVQNIQIVQSLLPRLMGTAKVKVETAGSSATEGTLEYVALDEARRIRTVVRAFQRRTASEEQEAPEHEAAVTSEVGASAPSPFADEAATRDAAEAETAGELLYAMPLRRVLLSGAFRFSLLYIALIFSAFQYVDVAPERLMRWAERGPLRDLTAIATASPWLVGLATVLGAALLSWVTGVLINLNRYYDFRLHLEDDKLHRRHGLFTLSEGTIPLEKVQALVLRTNPLMRLFGWYALELQTMGIDSDERGHQVAVPFAQRAEVERLARRIHPFALPETFRRVSPLTIRRSSIRYCVLLALVVAPVAHFLYTPAWWGLALAPLLVLLAYAQYRRHGFALDGDLFYVRRGVVKQYVWMLPAEKHQTFRTSASLFQRRLRLKSLAVDTAGAGGLAYPAVVDLPADEADAALHRLYATFQNRF